MRRESDFLLAAGARCASCCRRGAQAIFVIFGVACVTFFVLRLVPGDPARLMVPPGSSEDVVQTIRQQLGTDRPILEQFGIFLGGLLQGDLGHSFRYERPVLDSCSMPFRRPCRSGSVTILFSLLVAVPLGIAAAARPGGVVDRLDAGRRDGRPVAAEFLDRGDAGACVLDPAPRFAGDRQRHAWRLCPAGDHALGGADRDASAHSAAVDARGAARGLHPHRARQGRARAPGSSSFTR